MTGDSRTRQFSSDELERALEPFASAQVVVAARPIHVAGELLPEPFARPAQEPRTSLGVGPARAFDAPRSRGRSSAGVAVPAPVASGPAARTELARAAGASAPVRQAAALRSVGASVSAPDSGAAGSPRAAEARPSTPPGKPATKAAREPTQLTRSPHVDERFGRRLRAGAAHTSERAPGPAPTTRMQRTTARLGLPVLRVWHGWLALLVVAGFALGGLAALGRHGSRVAARPAALPTAPAASAARPDMGTPALAPRREPAALDARAPATALVERDVGVVVARRRSAVDALLAGRTRAALEHYQHLLAAPPPGLTDAPAIAQVAKLLELELRACEQEAGTPCGF
jgi:hypothetical protein